jgi:hypothetical protein
MFAERVEVVAEQAEVFAEQAELLAERVEVVAERVEVVAEQSKCSRNESKCSRNKPKWSRNSTTSQESSLRQGCPSQDVARAFPSWNRRGGEPRNEASGVVSSRIRFRDAFPRHLP